MERYRNFNTKLWTRLRYTRYRLHRILGLTHDDAPDEGSEFVTPLTQLQEAAPAPVVAAVAAPAVAAKQAATPTNFAANMIRRATLNMAAELANEGHRVTVEKNTFHPDGYKMEETKMTFHPKSGVEPKVAGSASVIAGSPGKK